MFCLLGSDTEQHFDAATQMSYRAHQGWTESFEKSIPIPSFRLRGCPTAMPLAAGLGNTFGFQGSANELALDLHSCE
jgi:hypothetical protein